MLDIVGVKTTASEYQATVPSLTAELPAGHQSGDLFVAVVLSGSSTAPTGPGGSWAQYDTPTSISSKRLSVWTLEASSSAELNPTWSLGSAVNWIVTIYCVRGKKASAYIDGSGTGRANFTTVTSAAEAAFSATNADSLILDVCAVANQSYIPSVQDNSLLLDSSNNISTSMALVCGRRTKVASGSFSSLTWLFQAAASGTLFTMTIAPDTADGVPVSAKTLPTVIKHYGLLDAGSYSSIDAALSLGGGTINGVAVNTANLPAGETSTPLDSVVSPMSRYLLTIGSAAWYGHVDTFASIVDVSNKILSVLWSAASSASSWGVDGVIVIFADDAATPNWVMYQLLPRKDFVTGGSYKTYITQIAVGQTPAFASRGAMDWTRLKKFGWGQSRTATGSNYMYLGKLIASNGLVLIGGSEAFPIGITSINAAFNGVDQTPGQTLFQGSGQLIARAPVTIGDGSIPTYLDLSRGSLETPTSADKFWKGTDNDISLTVNSGPSDTVDLRSAILRSNTRQTLVFNDSGATYYTTNASIIGYDVSFTGAVDVDTVAFAGCFLIDGDVSIFTANTFSSCQLTSGAALKLDGGASESLASGAPNSRFTKGGESYAVECRTAGHYNLVGATFAGSYTKHLYVSAMSGTVDVYVGSGFTLTYDLAPGSTATVVPHQPTNDVAFSSVAGSQIVAYEPDTTTELFRTNSSTGSDVWAGVSVAFDYTIQKAGYLPVRGTSAAPASDITIDPQQRGDRAYVASSGLTFGTNCFATPGTKKFGLTAASTLQNFYSCMIESWIAETTLRNKPFPIVPNGPASFTFADGWGWDLTTYPNSISNLSRDGMRYTDSSGNVTAMWAALLSVGVPAGMQVRYQQRDGLGTTNANGTGNIDQLIQILSDPNGDGTYTDGYDYRDWLVLKVQAAGYDQAEAVVLDIYPTLDDQLFVVALVPTPNGVAAGSADATVTITSEPTPVTWNGQAFSTTITDTTDAHTGLQIMQAIRALNDFNMHDMIRPHGSKFQTVTGNVYGDALTTPAGVRVVKADGVTPHPDFDLFIADNASTYVPPVVAPIGWDGALDGTTVLLYNDVGGGAGVIIDTQVISGAGGYNLDVTLPSGDVAVGDPLRIRFGHKQYYAGELQGTMTSTGWTAVGSMTLHPVYAGWALNGATYDQANGGPFTMDGPNLQVDIDAGTTTGTKKALGAWTQYLMTLPAGLDAFYGAWDLLDLNLIRQNVGVVNVMIDVPTAGALFEFTDNDVNYYRSDFTYPGNIQTGHGLIAITYNAKPFVATVAGSYAITGNLDDVASKVQDAMTAQGFTTTRAPKLDNLDAPISDVPTSSENAAATLAAANITPIASDMKKTNGELIIGDGTTANKFRSHRVP